MINSACYCTREQVQNAPDIKGSARNNDQVDRAIESAVGTVEGLLHRSFYPVTATKYFPWPQGAGTSYRLWLHRNELISVTTLTSGGVAIGVSDYFLEPNEYGPPYNRVELDISSSASFGGGDTPQRDIAITGVWGYKDTQVLATTTAEALDVSETGVDVSNSANIGVGNVIVVDSERMLVTGKSLTSVDLCGSIDANRNDTSFSVFTGSQFRAGEVIVIDSEKMKIVEVVSNSLIVIRAWDGTPLAAHSNGAAVYAYRTLEVTRGALGTTAATHSTSASVYVQQVPALVQQLAIAEAINFLQQESGGYSASTGSGAQGNNLTGGQLDAIRKQAYAQYGRQARMRSV